MAPETTGMGCVNNMEVGYIIQFKLVALLSEKGFIVSMPCDPCCSYDLIVDSNSHLFRIQVKCCTTRKRNRYRVDISCGFSNKKKPYKANAFDFFIVAIPETQSWYVIPLNDVIGSRTISVYPHNKRGKYEKYRENWSLLS